jgi:hypothetical protein
MTIFLLIFSFLLEIRQHWKSDKFARSCHDWGPQDLLAQGVEPRIYRCTQLLENMFIKRAEDGPFPLNTYVEYAEIMVPCDWWPNHVGDDGSTPIVAVILDQRLTKCQRYAYIKWRHRLSLIHSWHGEVGGFLDWIISERGEEFAKYAHRQQVAFNWEHIEP